MIVYDLLNTKKLTADHFLNFFGEGWDGKALLTTLPSFFLGLVYN